MKNFKMFFGLVVAFLAIFAFSFNTMAQDTVIKITAEEDPDINGQALTAAIKNAVSGSSIYLSAGFYQGNFALKAGVSIYGGFKDDTWNFNDRDPSLTVCNGYNYENPDNGAVFFATTRILKRVELDGLTIRNGTGVKQESDELRYGGGVYAYARNSTIILKNCILLNNTADYGGGIAYGIVQGCSLLNNNANISGGATWRTARVRSSILANNSAEDVGGAIFAAPPSIIASDSIFHCLIVMNGTKSLTGGSAVVNGELEDCLVWGNCLYDDDYKLYKTPDLESVLTDTILGCAIEGKDESFPGILFTLGSANKNVPGPPYFLSPTTFVGPGDIMKVKYVTSADWRISKYKTAIPETMLPFLKRLGEVVISDVKATPVWKNDYLSSSTLSGSIVTPDGNQRGGKLYVE